MITTVTGKHQVTIPAKLANRLNIVSGSKLEWELLRENGEIRVRVLPSRRSLANALLGAGKKLTGSSPA